MPAVPARRISCSTFEEMGGGALLQGLWKSLATGITVGAGGSAGMVGPTFFVGAMGGDLRGTSSFSVSGTFCPFGSRCGSRGAANVPVAAVVFLVELWGFSALLPGMILCGLSYGVARKWNLFDPGDLLKSP